MDQVSSQSSQPPAEVTKLPTAPSLAPSPYRHLMEEAHHTAYSNQTPHGMSSHDLPIILCESRFFIIRNLKITIPAIDFS